MINKSISQQLAEKTIRELAKPIKAQSRSRVWKDPQGYRYLFPWSNAVLLRFLIRKFTDNLPKKEFRRKTQIDDAGRSTVRNIEEGFKRPTTAEYLNFLGYSQASLEEVKGDVRELTEDRFLKSVPGSSLAGIGLNLRDFRNSLLSSNHPLTFSNNPLKDSKGNSKETKGNTLMDFTYKPLTILYPPLKNIQVEDLTYEIFIELINKTDYLLRTLVTSLENKLDRDQKFYQVERARIRGNLAMEQ